jgi:photosystem II stability/assembly factor-like uncharacterized protein
MSRLRVCTLLMAAVLALCIASAAQQWTPLGPEGGDVRSLAYDPEYPDRLYLGTSAGQIYVSNDRGQMWQRLARLGDGDDYVLDNIAIDPSNTKVIYVAAWSVENHFIGDLFKSTDGGKTWAVVAGMKGKSIRAMALAASDPKIIVVGALDGVFRSADAGRTWQRISPENHAEIKNIESIAIDPKDPEVIYAGTWHLPWKTENGGRSWHSIKKGIIDDSDVFSIIVDPMQTNVVYASACSGIYKSEDGGAQFRKIQGIPFSARRTRVLQQDPVNRNVVYAGTTEGLWKTTDAGATWSRTTDKNLIINDVLLDPRNPQRVMLATDRSGVLSSEDGGFAFRAVNRGFAHRQVAALLVDRNDSLTLYAGVINDKEFGGAFVSHDGGHNWRQISAGLGGRDVFILRQGPKGEILAGTNRGVFQLLEGAGKWVPLNTTLTEIQRKVRMPGAGKKSTKYVASTVRGELKARVTDMHLDDDAWVIATTAGLFTSRDRGQTWHGGPVLDQKSLIAVDVSPQMLVAAAPRALVVSLDRGKTWYHATLPKYLTAVYGVAVDERSNIWLATREGAFRSLDQGDTWEHVLAGLPARHVVSIAYDHEGRRLLATATSTQHVYESTNGGRQWKPIDSGWRLRAVTSARGRLFATTYFDGIVAQPSTSAPTTTAAGGGGGGSAE